MVAAHLGECLRKAQKGWLDGPAFPPRSGGDYFRLGERVLLMAAQDGKTAILNVVLSRPAALPLLSVGNSYSFERACSPAK